MATELTQPVLFHDNPEHRLLADHHGVPHTHAVHSHAVPVQAVPVVIPVVQQQLIPQHAEVVKHRPSPLKSLLALFLLALAAILIGLLAYQAHTFFGGFLVTTTGNFTDGNNNDNDDDDNYRNDGDDGAIFDNGSNGNNGGVWLVPFDNVGFNGAGAGMFFFGILFAVLQAVTAVTMWVHLAYFMPHLKHSSVMGPLKVTAAVGFIALGFACRHISLGARHDTSETHHRVTHAIEAFIIINWFFVVLTLILSLVSPRAHWDCENIEEHKITRKMTAGYTQLFLAIVLIGLLAAFFQWYTERWLVVTAATEIFLVFAIMFAVLQAISGVAMIQQCGHNAPGQMPETVHALLKVVIAFGIIAFGFACRSIYVTTHSVYYASPHLIAIEAFVIINFVACLYFAYASSTCHLMWDNYNTTVGDRAPGFLFGILQVVMSIILFGLLAGLLQGLTANESESTNSINRAGKYLVWFGLLFAVLEFFAGCTMLESGTKRLGGLNPASVSVTNKVALALGALAFGFACRHINLHERSGREDPPREPLVHAIEAFIILNFLLTWLIDWLCVRGKIEW